MKLVMVAALIAGCGGAKPEPAPRPDTSPKAAAETQAVLAAGFNDEGVKAMYDGRYAIATEHFRNAVARVPEPKYFFNLCTSLFQEGKLVEAKTACTAVDVNRPAPELSEKAHALIARIDAEASAQGVPLEAQGDPRAIDPMGADPADSGTQAQIAAKLSKEGVELMYAQKYSEASARFREAVARVPEPKYFFNLCTSLFQEGKLVEAKTACTAVDVNRPVPELVGEGTRADRADRADRGGGERAESR